MTQIRPELEISFHYVFGHAQITNLNKLYVSSVRGQSEPEPNADAILQPLIV